MLGINKRSFKYLNIQCFTLLYKSMVRSHLDYCSSVWNPYHKGDIEALEKVQKRGKDGCQGVHTKRQAEFSSVWEEGSCFWFKA